MGNSLLAPARLSTQPDRERDDRMGNHKSNQREHQRPGGLPLRLRYHAAASRPPQPMKKTPARFVLAIAATLLLVLICYGLARAYLYYDAARAEHMMRELGDVKLGDSEAQVLPILERYGDCR